MKFYIKIDNKIKGMQKLMGGYIPSKATKITQLAEDIKKDVEESFNKLIEESHSTHSCPDENEDYECHCTNPKIEDQNCWVIPKVKFNEIFGEFK